MKRLRRLLTVLVGLILVLAVLLTGLGTYTVRRSFPQTTGTLQVPGLAGPVEVYRDGYGVAHIYADTPHDLFMAQGYVHAQERFYQMDFWRHTTAGRLSELFGARLVEADSFLRTLGWRRVAEQEYEATDEDTRAIFSAYADGVNAYLSTHAAADLSLEYSILALIGLSHYQPEPWTPVDSLAWGKAMAWDLDGNLNDEIQRAGLLQALGPERTQEYLPSYPAGHPVIFTSEETLGLSVDSLRARLGTVEALVGAQFEGSGSNSWVIAGRRTTTGQPLLANDPHLSIQMPSIWYEAGLHCNQVTAACPYEVTGFSFAGVPGIIIGHSSRIAWGFTNLGADIQDLFIEKINPANPTQYEVNGRWVDMTVVEETIKILGGEERSLTVRYTRHGPILNDVYWNGAGVEVNGIALDAGHGLALRSTALEPGFTFRAILKMNRAQNWEEFREALRDFSGPSQNIVYADVDGNIGYQASGRIPIRAKGDGLVPVPGWTDAYEWQGYIPFEKLPYVFNPPEGYIVTANNAVVDDQYPYLISRSWDPGYRARRIVDLINAQPQISPDDIEQMQGDDMNLGAKEQLPYLLALEFDDPRLVAAVAQLQHWDGQMRLDSQPAAIYAAFYNALLANTFHDDVPEAYWPGSGGNTWVVLHQLLQDPVSAWWDDATTPGVETRDDILRQSFQEGYAALESALGANPARWQWGKLHTATFANATLGRSGFQPIEALFNRGPYPVAGGGSIVNATHWNPSRPDPYAVRALPSMRMIVDLGNLDGSKAMHTPGQSGHAYAAHYDDMADPWRLIQYHAMLWSRAAVEQGAEAHLTLKP